VKSVLGGVVGNNENLGQLIDPKALEVVFRVSKQEFERLVSAPGGLIGIHVDVTLGPGNERVEATLDRVGAAVGEGQTGRELFAGLGDAGASFLRPGDFVTVRVHEPELTGVAVIPTKAASSKGEVLVVGEGNRLRKMEVGILRKQGEMLIVNGDGLVGESLVLERAPQLGEGILIQPRRQSEPLFTEEPMVALTEGQQQAITAAIEANNRMPQEVKDRIIEQVMQGSVPTAMADRLQNMIARSSGNRTPSGNGESGNPAAQRSSTPEESRRGSGNETERAFAAETRTEENALLTLSTDERQKLVNFVQNNSRIPAGRKDAILESLAEPEVPKDLVDRLRSRMGS